MRSKGKLLALMMMVAAVGVVTATGAFTTVQADRTVDVNVAADSAALLGLVPNGTNPNGDYASENTDGALEIALDSGNAVSGGGEGVNVDAITHIDHVFDVSNQGTQDITLSVSYTVNTPAGFTAGDGNQFYLYYYDTGTRVALDGTPVTIPVGESKGVGIYIDSTGLTKSDSIDVTVTLNAEACESC